MRPVPACLKRESNMVSVITDVPSAMDRRAIICGCCRRENQDRQSLEVSCPWPSPGCNAHSVDREDDLRSDFAELEVTA
jgi:hypothetical protein